MIAPIVHVFSRLPDRLLVRLMPLYDAYCRALYRLLLRAAVRRPGDPRGAGAALRDHGQAPRHLQRLPACAERSEHALITTPIERITRDGVRTVDGVDHPADLIVPATGYELWTDPETYRPGTILGAADSTSPSTTALTACRAMPARRIRDCPTGGRSSARSASSASRGATSSRRWPHTRYASSTRRAAAATQVAEVSQDAFNRWNSRWRRRGKTAHLYLTDCNPELNTYFVNSHRDTVYHRPQTITGSRRFARRVAADRLPVHPAVGAHRHATTEGATRMTDTSATGRQGRLRHRSRSRTRPIALRAAGPGRRRRRRDRRLRSGRRAQRLPACDAGGPRRDGEPRRGRGPQDPGQGGRRPRRRRPAAGGRRRGRSSSAGSTSWSPTPAC